MMLLSSQVVLRYMYHICQTSHQCLVHSLPKHAGLFEGHIYANKALYKLQIQPYHIGYDCILLAEMLDYWTGWLGLSPNYNILETFQLLEASSWAKKSSKFKLISLLNWIN